MTEEEEEEPINGLAGDVSRALRGALEMWASR